GNPPPAPKIDLAQASVAQLVALHSHANEWWVRQARLQLTARVAGSPVAAAQLRALFASDAAAAQPVLRLRALWSLFSIGATDEVFLRACLRDADEHVRTWAIRLLSDAWPLDTVLSQRPLQANPTPPAPSPAVLTEFQRLAADDPSALVRLALASVLQRLPTMARVPVATALVRHAADADDHNLPLLIWYGLIPVAAPATAAELPGIAAACALPITRQLIARRLSEDLDKNPAPINALLALAAQRPAAFQGDILNGLADGLRGWRRAPKPAAWEALASAALPNAAPALAARIRELNVVFGDGRALDEIKRLVLDPKAELDARQAALRTLIENRPPDLRAICEQVLSERFLNTVALRGLTQFDDPTLGEKITKSYLTFHHSERAAVIAALVSRPSFASALLAAINAGRIPRADLTPFHARQIRSFKSATLDAALTRAWGDLREPAADKRALITRLETQLTPAALAAADKGRGRAVFNNLCAACHQLYGQGGNLGPDLTGAGRDSLAYLLENIADPSAVVTADYRMNIVKLKDGRTLNGFIAAKTARTLSLRSLTETTVVERTEISSIVESKQSVMPEGLLEAIQPSEVADLIAYLMHPTQVPLP
ncbi:MAG: c-type cytochrome, partial [Opitutaceae bacterium]